MLDKLSEDWSGLKSIVIYGYGRRAARLIKSIARNFEITDIIDNNEKLVGTSYNGIYVHSFEEVKDKLAGKKVIVTTGGGSYFSIKEGLESIGMQEFRDFCRYEDFFVEWFWKNKRQVVLSECFLCVTSRCTFKCKNCNQMMPYFTDKTHYTCSVDEVIETLDAFFSKVDFLMSMFIIGGEPLLHKDLPEIIERISDKYGNKVGYIQIITNASLIPSESLMSTIKKHNIDIRLSDYTFEIPYTKRFEEVKSALNNAGIEYSVSKYEEWFDVGIPGKEEKQFTDINDIKAHTIACGPCHVIAEKKFFYCGTFYNAQKCGLAVLEKGDYIDLTEETSDAAKEKLLEYSLGKFVNGYISVCNYCFGKSENNKRIVRPAIQFK